MAPYNYNNFYDPVGSQANQSQGYSYSNTNNPPSSAAQYPNPPASSYQTSYGSNSFSNQYGTQTYGTAPQQQSSTQPARNSARAANALSSLTPQDYSQSAATNRANNQYDDSAWNGSGTGSYNNNTAYSQQTGRNQANTSPLYPPSSASTFGRLSLPDQSQTQSSHTFGSSQSLPAASSNASNTPYQNVPTSTASQHRQYMAAYTHQQNSQPPERYASPLQAVQAQQRQNHNRQTSRNSNSNPQPSPRIAAQNLQQQQEQQQRQHSTSVEPSPTTVDPSQVYDFRAEQERKARIDAERRKKIEAEQAAQKAEEDARQKVEDDRKAAEAARVAEAERLEAARLQAEEDAKKAEEEAAKQQQAREKKNEQRRKAREEKRQSKTAATALQQMASGAGTSNNDGQAASMAMMAAMMGDQSQPAANDEEAEMRAMFAKMRDFNAKNPALLAKMWEEERSAHAQSPAQPTARPAAPPPPLPPPATKKASKAQQKTQSSASSATPAAQPYQLVAGVKQAGNGAPQSGAPGKAPAPVQAPPKQTGGNSSLWPPHKKGALAEAAAKWLAGRPENLSTGFTISREQVLQILDTNPSYVQLCEMIEKTGMKFERSALARELLKAVPDGLRNSTPGKPAAASPANGMTAQMNAAAVPQKRGPKAKSTYSVPNQGGRPASKGTVSYQSPSFSSLTDAARAINGMSTAPSYPNHSLASALGGVQSPKDGPYFVQPPVNIEDDYQPMIDSTPAPVEVKPERPPRPPADKEEAARKRTFGDLVDLTVGDDSDDEGPPRKILQSQRPPPVPIPNLLPTSSLTPLQRAQQMMQSKLGTQHIGKPVNTDPFMRQNGYGRPTKYPTQPPGGVTAPPPQGTKPKGPSQEQLQHERMRGKMLVEPIMRDRVARKSKYDVRTIARDVLLATGRHPDMRALNAHLNTMQKLLGDHGGVVDGAGNKSDLSTIKWSLIDPGEPAAETKGEEETTKARVDVSDATEGADDEDEPTNPPDSRGADNHRQNVGLPKRKRGRPAKKDAQSAQPSDDALEPVTSPGQNNTSTTSPTTKRRRRRTDSITTPLKKDGSPTMSSAGGPVGYSAFRELDANGNVIKKKGRPVGWRKSIHSREAQGLTPAKTGAKPLGGTRLRQSATAVADVTPPRREYAVYKCEWKGCRSEMDGLERLRKHVLKVHGVPSRGEEYECKWEGCGVKSGWEDVEGWLSHVDAVHLESVGWKLGDGMRGEGE